MTKGLAAVSAHPPARTARKPAPVARTRSARDRQGTAVFPMSVMNTISPTGRNASEKDMPSAITIPDAAASRALIRPCRPDFCGDRAAQAARAKADVESKG